MAWSLKRRWVDVLVLVVLLAGSAIAGRVVVPLMRTTDHFIPFSGDERVRFEPGAEAAAGILARALPDAIRTIERAHFRPFAKPVRVYVCATEESFERHAFGVQGAGGYVYGGRLFISPKPQNTVERLPRLLTHELSHLHFEQRAGMWRMAGAVPGWFKEGLAVHAAGGGGAENVSEAEARDAIVRNRVFRRDETGSLLFPQTGARDGLPAHLFYRESALFVAFLAQRSPEGFAQLVSAVQDRKRFAAAVRDSYASDIPKLWDEFVARLKATAKPASP